MFKEGAFDLQCMGSVVDSSRSMQMVRVDNLMKSYGNAQAVRGISFEIPRGQVVGFLGPNGAGKTTTMRMLTGYLASTSGNAFVAGIDVAKNPVEARRLIGYLPENNPLYDDMMVIEYLQFIAAMRDLGARSNDMIKSAATRCGIMPVLGKDVGALSRGYRQRVGLAQAILHDPPLLILDEPTSGLDPNQIIEIRSLIRELGQEKTVLMSTHILGEVQSTCSRVLIVNEGRLVADDTPEHLSRREGGVIHVELARPEGGKPNFESVQKALSTVVGVSSVERDSNQANEMVLSVLVRHGTGDPRAGIFSAVVTSNWILLEMRRHEISLEETFRQLTME
jgi:ABC-2 type transport system ATP-binding protein